jgi:predicted permease
MTPRVGMPVAFAILAVAFAAAGGAWTIASPVRRRAFRERLRTRAAWGGVAAGMLAWTIGLGVAGPVDSHGSEHPLWLYISVAMVGYVLPSALAIVTLARWVRRHMPEEWHAVTAGEMPWSQLPLRLHVAGVATAAAMVVPGTVMTMVLFG